MELIGRNKEKETGGNIIKKLWEWVGYIVIIKLFHWSFVREKKWNNKFSQRA